MLRRMLFMLLGVALIVAVLAGLKFYSIQKQIAQFTAPRPPISVSASHAEQVDWQRRLPAIGTLRANQGVTLTSEVSGTVSQLLFTSGERVRQGQPLLQLEASEEAANLRTAEADLGLAHAEYARGRELIDSRAISRSEFDRLASQEKRNMATVAQLKATLDKKRILAPFSGTVGIRQVDLGDYLSPGTAIATLQDLTTLLVDFYLPEQDFPRLQRGQLVSLQVAAYPGERFEAHIDAINPRVDNETRNLLVRASLPNPNQRLLPGMFANLEVQLAEQAPQVVVPETAVTFTLYGNSVYVVVPGQSKDDKPAPALQVERRFVKVGERRDGKAVILDGLKVGEQVVTSGQLKLDNGSAVAIAADAKD
ncbi:MAG: Multidrug resistance protein MexA [Stenotrophomonas maltophilia]|nr:MAG: Multidrug resistance protein MexA [Stenotrophomonas maltophilia]